ncbi:sugar phosphate isomerase/epimerase family protein [Mumia zhuanghuii]|uniref:Sugar phosphate isomerase/epimerase n=1 Tax=Mumia zhuanghuii TaxID=2585211 RepID=A0A5C4MHX1_9ACTN|nr:sugar phosphate isomerase/epimerase [Mumia zhuanghuii]TNC41015.1 sugar phosphate isomerase/epimerase [Mumia zhuanghuii]TNC49241.1 sugar phosphate isomerase/epimerase [Mumia zhuanghuii]
MTDPAPPVSVPSARVALSTSSVYPESTEVGFEIGKRLGYDGVEVMVGTDATSADIDAIVALQEQHEIPVLSVHAPCLLITQRVWGTDHWVKLEKSAEMARACGAGLVVVHPPFRWQREYARAFEEGVAKLEENTGVVFAVENMYPWRTGKREFQAYAPGWDPVVFGYEHVTLDVSHCATSGSDPLVMATELGDRLAHVHLGDGSGSPRDEHLVPGRGEQPVGELLGLLAEQGYAGDVAVEVTTRKAVDRAQREADLAEALAFTRLHLASPVVPHES